jgi:hypothetical protein
VRISTGIFENLLSNLIHKVRSCRLLFNQEMESKIEGETFKTESTSSGIGGYGSPGDANGNPQTPPGSERGSLPTPLPSGSVYREQLDLGEEPSASAEPRTHHRLGISLEAVNRQVPPIPSDIDDIINLTEDDMGTMTEEAAKTALKRAVDVVEQLLASLKSFQSLISQYQLQNKLLTIETHEAAQRHEVENNIVKREVDRLRIETLGSADKSSEAETSRRRLRKMKAKLKDATEQLNEKDAEINALKSRLSNYIPPIQPFPPAQSVSAASLPPPPGAAAAAAAATAAHPPHQESYRSQPQPPRENGLAALEMLASQVLSQQILPSPERHSPPSAKFPPSQPSPKPNLQKGLMSPLEFNESPTQPMEKRRRDSSASTITIPSEDDQDDDDDDEERQRGYAGTSAGSPTKYSRQDEVKKIPVGRILDFSK